MLSKLQIALGVAGVLAFVGMAGVILWQDAKIDAANKEIGSLAQREATALAAAAANKAEFERYRGQHEGAEKIAIGVARMIEEQRLDFEKQNRRTYSAPLDKNNVVPGTLSDTYHWLWQRRQNAGVPTGAGGASGAAGSPSDRLPAPAANGPARKLPKQRRTPARGRSDRADRGGRPLPHRGRRLEGLGHLYAAAREGR